MLEINVKSHAKARFHDMYDLCLELERLSEHFESDCHQFAREQWRSIAMKAPPTETFLATPMAALPPAVDPIHPKRHVHPFMVALVRASVTKADILRPEFRLTPTTTSSSA